MENHPEWVVHDEIPLTTASITKYKAGINEQWYYIIRKYPGLATLYTGRMLLKWLVWMVKVLW